MGVLEIIFWASAGLCVYVYAGYPLLLWCLGRVRSRPPVKGPVTPPVSIIIAAHNEARQLASKIENTLALDYPPGLMEIIVASDGSTDATEEIASRYERSGVTLLRLPRCGKMSALNRAAAHAGGEIFVFTDANALLEQSALRELLAPFADAGIGGVCGNQKYGAPSNGGDSAGEGENLYWTYDKYLKHLETRVGSTVAADGSLYALRRELYVPVEDGAQADDFAVSARVVTAGRRRLVYEPAAVSVEPRPGASDMEFWRKVRIANHGMRAILDLEGALNPLRTGFYAVQLWSHKTLRYLFPFFAAAALATNVALAQNSGFFRLLLLAQCLFYGLALAGWALRRNPLGRLKPLCVPFYFCLANAAVFLGMLSLLRGYRITTWQPQRETHTGRIEK
jgi:cellulose synthase/poly-beta-1,6-N-acetylglucosamine synthase-like glycosyltransferase